MPACAAITAAAVLQQGAAEGPLGLARAQLQMRSLATAPRGGRYSARALFRGRRAKCPARPPAGGAARRIAAQNAPSPPCRRWHGVRSFPWQSGLSGRCPRAACRSSVFFTVVSGVAHAAHRRPDRCDHPARDRPRHVARGSRPSAQRKPHVEVNLDVHGLAVLGAGREGPLPHRLDGRVVEAVGACRATASPSTSPTDAVGADDELTAPRRPGFSPPSPPACSAASLPCSRTGSTTPGSPPFTGSCPAGARRPRHRARRSPRRCDPLVLGAAEVAADHRAVANHRPADDRRRRSPSR